MAQEKTLDFAPNYCHVIEIDITPENPVPTWANVLVGITECAPANEETVDEDDFYDNLGLTESTVSKVSPSIALTGYRKYGAPAQDFIQSKALSTGKDRKTRYRWTMPDGELLTGECTLADLIPGSSMGESSAKGEFTCTIKLNTIDGHVEGSSVEVPESITAQDVTVATGDTSVVTATVSPSGANQKCHFAIDDETIASVDANGTVKGVASGTTTLTVKAASKPSIVKQISVTVS